jgi:hypothetical protein
LHFSGYGVVNYSEDDPIQVILENALVGFQGGGSFSVLFIGSRQLNCEKSPQNRLIAMFVVGLQPMAKPAS